MAREEMKFTADVHSKKDSAYARISEEIRGGTAKKETEQNGNKSR